MNNTGQMGRLEESLKTWKPFHFKFRHIFNVKQWLDEWSLALSYNKSYRIISFLVNNFQQYLIVLPAPSDQNGPKSNNEVVHGCKCTKTFPGIEIVLSFCLQLIYWCFFLVHGLARPNRRFPAPALNWQIWKTLNFCVFRSQNKKIIKFENIRWLFFLWL